MDEGGTDEKNADRDDERISALSLLIGFVMFLGQVGLNLYGVGLTFIPYIICGLYGDATKNDAKECKPTRIISEK